MPPLRFLSREPSFDEPLSHDEPQVLICVSSASPPKDCDLSTSEAGKGGNSYIANKGGDSFSANDEEDDKEFDQCGALNLTGRS